MDTKKAIAFILGGLVSLTLSSDVVFDDPDANYGHDNYEKAFARVENTVGEEPYFLYNLRGHTYSRDRISIESFYVPGPRGYVNLFLAAEFGIHRYQVDYNDRNDLLVLLVNNQRNEFYYTVRVPRGVHAYGDLSGEQFNFTSLIVRGPSRYNSY